MQEGWAASGVVASLAAGEQTPGGEVVIPFSYLALIWVQIGGAAGVSSLVFISGNRVLPRSYRDGLLAGGLSDKFR